MSVKLKVIHGALKKNDRFQVVIPITKTPSQSEERPSATCVATARPSAAVTARSA